MRRLVGQAFAIDLTPDMATTAGIDLKACRKRWRAGASRRWLSRHTATGRPRGSQARSPRCVAAAPAAAQHHTQTSSGGSLACLIRPLSGDSLSPPIPGLRARAPRRPTSGGPRSSQTSRNDEAQTGPRPPQARSGRGERTGDPNHPSLHKASARGAAYWPKYWSTDSAYMRYAVSLSRICPGVWRMECARAEQLLIALSQNQSAALRPVGTPKYVTNPMTRNCDAPGTAWAVYAEKLTIAHFL